MHHVTANTPNIAKRSLYVACELQLNRLSCHVRSTAFLHAPVVEAEDVDVLEPVLLPEVHVDTDAEQQHKYKHEASEHLEYCGGGREQCTTAHMPREPISASSRLMMLLA